MKKFLPLLLATTLLGAPSARVFAAAKTAKAAPAQEIANDELPIVGAPPGVAIDLYPVSATKVPGGRFIDAPSLARLGYVEAAPALQVERLRGVRKVKSAIRQEVQSVDGKKRGSTVPAPAVEITLFSADARAFAALMKKSVGQRIYIEAQGTPIYAPMVREALSASTLTFNQADEKQQESVFRKLAAFVKK